MKTLIKSANIVNEGKVFQGDILIDGDYISKIGSDLSADHANRVIDASRKHVFPGAIDDQVHFREPGLTHKATIATESRAAVAGGVTSFMEMPNTSPPTFTQELLEQKYQIAAQTSLANFSFFMGSSNDNLDEVLKTDLSKVCGLKIFMGSSTGNLLVDNPAILESFFREFPGLIATHCEDEATIRTNTEIYRAKYGDDIPVDCHPLIRSREACLKSSRFAIELAKKFGTRLHVLHISTAEETELFSNSQPLHEKKITAEACIHHLWFSDEDYARLGTFIKWNPAVKGKTDRQAILRAVLDDRIDVIATDHAPHTLEEKSQGYFKAPSGGPLVQHSMVAMLEMYHQGRISLPAIVTKMSHNPAILFRIEKRGFIREGYFADLVIANLSQPWTVAKDNVLAKCGWSPFEGQIFRSTIVNTFVSGHLAYADGSTDDSVKGRRLTFQNK